MLSPRFAPAILALTTVALGPTIIHRYLGAVHDDGRRAETIAAIAPDAQGQPGERTSKWVMNTFASDDWSERSYRSARGDVTLFVVRSYDTKRLFHHPELALWHGVGLTEHLAEFPDLPDVPVHVLQPRERERPGLGGYCLHYGDSFVGNPYRFELRRALTLTISVRQKMTLFFAHDEREKRERPADDTLVGRVLTETVRNFLGGSPSRRR